MKKVQTGRVGNRKTVQRFGARNRKQAGYLGKQAESVGQEQVRSIRGKQAGNKRWSVSHITEYSLALSQSQTGAYYRCRLVAIEPV